MYCRHSYPLNSLCGWHESAFQLQPHIETDSRQSTGKADGKDLPLLFLQLQRQIK